MVLTDKPQNRGSVPRNPYLDLAMHAQLPLVTLDEPLRKAARKCGVALYGKN